MLILILVICILNCLFLINGLKETNKHINKLEEKLEEVKRDRTK